MLFCGKHHFCILWMLRSFLISCKKAKVQKTSVVCQKQRKGEPEVTQLHLQCAEKFICVAFSGRTYQLSFTTVATLFSISSLIYYLR